MVVGCKTYYEKYDRPDNQNYCANNNPMIIYKFNDICFADISSVANNQIPRAEWQGEYAEDCANYECAFVLHMRSRVGD